MVLIPSSTLIWFLFPCVFIVLVLLDFDQIFCRFLSVWGFVLEREFWLVHFGTQELQPTLENLTMNPLYSSPGGNFRLLPFSGQRDSLVFPSASSYRDTNATQILELFIEEESESRSVVSDALQPHGLHSPRNPPGQNTGVGSLSLPQGIFSTLGSNSGLPHCRWILDQLSPHKGSPWILEWVAYSFSRGSSRPRSQTGVSCIAGGFFTSWAVRELLIVCL